MKTSTNSRFHTEFPGARSIVAGFFHLLHGRTGAAARAFTHAKLCAVQLPAKIIADRLAKHATAEGRRQLIEQFEANE